MSSLLTNHIQLDDRGVAWIDDTNIKVIEVALEKIAHGCSPEEIYDRHDGHLEMSQIHAALAYYYDNKAEMENEIDRQFSEFQAQRGASLDSPVRRRLRSQGRLS